MKERSASNWLMNGATVIMTVVVVMLAVFRVKESVTRGDGLPEPVPALVEDWEQYGTGERLGPADARVTIVEFGDFLCPFCQQAATEVREIRRRWPNDVAVVYRHLIVHPEARDASLAAECARSEGRFEMLHDALYLNPESIGVKPWGEWAIEAGVRDTVEFLSCMVDPATDSIIVRDSLAARALRIPATPTFLINNRQYVGRLGVDRMTEYVKKAMKESGAIRRTRSAAAP